MTVISHPIFPKSAMWCDVVLCGVVENHVVTPHDFFVKIKIHLSLNPYKKIIAGFQTKSGI